MSLAATLQMAVALGEEFIHGIKNQCSSNDDRNHASWYHDNDCKAFLSTVQGSDNTILLGKLLYSGPFLDANCITEQLQQVCADKFPDPIRFGCRLSKSLEIPLAPQKYRNWTLAENQLVKVEVNHNDVKRLKKVMYAYINKKSDFCQHPGPRTIQDEVPS